MRLQKIQTVKVVYCPKRHGFIFLSDCEKCRYFSAIKRIGRYNYVECKCLEEVDSDGDK